MIVIVDYGMGNLHSVKRAIAHISPNLNIKISNIPQDLENASHIILPGQGGIADCMSALNSSNLKDTLLNVILHKKKPTLGICVGMQMLFEESEEGKILTNQNTNINIKCLGILNGVIKKFSKEDISLDSEYNHDYIYKVPHMGWNNINLNINNDIWLNIPNKSSFYFIHSYYLPINQQTAKYSIATCDYGVEFICAVAHENIIATQFHPEKSSTVGLQLYKNFINLA